MLTIIVVIGSIAVPAVDRALERQKIRGAADEMRMAWDSARIKAMRTGQAQVFQCQIGTNTYTIQPLTLHDDVNNIGQGATILNAGVAVTTQDSTFGMTTQATDTSKSSDQKIDDSLKFTSCIVASDLRSLSVAQSGDNATVNVQTVAQSVIFYPDGSTTSAELKMQNERGEVTGVQIRGITGHTKLVALSVPEGAATP